MKTTKASDAALGVISAATVGMGVVRITDQRLDRKLYLEVAQLLGALGGKWNHKAAGFVFDSNPTEKIEHLLITGEVVLPKDWGFFPTPTWLAKQMVEIADIKPGDVVLEPSAGNGAILKEIAAVTSNYWYTELNPDCRTRLGLNFGTANILPQPDFMQVPTIPLFDRIVMNPPFAKQQDIDHVLRAYAMLKPGGKVVAIMAAGCTFRRDGKATAFRMLVDECGGSITPLPDDSFAESGTHVRAVLVVLPAGGVAA